jgi:hypothetical protein
VVPIVEAVIQGPIQRTNRLGEPLGLPTTLKELVASTALEALTKPVKESYKYLSGVGVPKDDSRSLVEYFVDRYVRLALVNEIKQVAEDVVKATQFGGQLTDDLQNGLVAALRQAADRMQAQGDSARPA